MWSLLNLRLRAFSCLIVAGWLFALPVLMILWVNLHVYFFLGLFLIGAFWFSDAAGLVFSKLTDEEFRIMQQHVNHGIDIVARSEWLRDAAEVVGCHHEKINGAGYPHGLKETEIPLTARIFAIADVFDALTAKRPYKAPFSFEEAIALMDEAAGTHFDPVIIDAFTSCIDGFACIFERFNE